MRVTGRRLIAAVAFAGIVLVATYVVAGGGRFEPVRSADPCDVRPWRNPSGFQAIVEQILLSGADGAACDLGMTREELILALADQGELTATMDVRGIDDARLEKALRSGLRRAVLDGQQAGAIAPAVAFVAGQAIDRIDLAGLIGAYRSGRLDWLGAFIP
jgi:hypothetical protein